MRKIERTTQFKKDYKRSLKSHFGKKLDHMLVNVLQLLVNDHVILEKYKDHPLQGEYNN